MNAELRAALDLLDSAIETARAALEPELELPEVTVNIDSYRWTAIARADCHVCDDGSLLTGIIGVAERYGEHTIHTSTLTPAQVVRLCELAGWPKPEVRMVLTYCDGSPCEVDPANVEIDKTIRRVRQWTQHTEVSTWEDDSHNVYIVRESVETVERMRAAFAEQEGGAK